MQLMHPTHPDVILHCMQLLMNMQDNDWLPDVAYYNRVEHP